MTFDGIDRSYDKGFLLLLDNPQLYYRVEPDGSVVIKGEKRKCLFNTTLSDRSRLMGGVTINGMLFGDRQHEGVHYQIRWMEEIQAEPEPPPLPKAPTMRQIKEWEECVERMKGQYNDVRLANSRLETELRQLKQSSTETLKRLKAEFDRRTTQRTVLLESTLRDSDQVEGHKTETWEVGTNKYLVVAQRPKGIEGSWTGDICTAVSKKLAGAEVAVVVVPEGSNVRVVEIIPIAEIENDDQGQF